MSSLSPASETLRAFVALELPPDVKRALSAVRAALGARVPPARWVRPEGMRLTLKFLGETPVERIPGIADSLRRAAAGTAPFSLYVAGTGVFPNPRKARLLWAGLQGETEACAALQSRVEVALEQHGFKPEARGFSPHLTLARFRNPCPVPADALTHTPDPAGFTARRMVFFQSTLEPRGAVYTPLATLPFE